MISNLLSVLSSSERSWHESPIHDLSSLWVMNYYVPLQGMLMSKTHIRNMSLLLQVIHQVNHVIVAAIKSAIWNVTIKHLKHKNKGKMSSIAPKERCFWKVPLKDFHSVKYHQKNKCYRKLALCPIRLRTHPCFPLVCFLRRLGSMITQMKINGKSKCSVVSPSSKSLLMFWLHMHQHVHDSTAYTYQHCPRHQRPGTATLATTTTARSH